MAPWTTAIFLCDPTHVMPKSDAPAWFPHRPLVDTTLATGSAEDVEEVIDEVFIDVTNELDDALVELADELEGHATWAQVPNSALQLLPQYSLELPQNPHLLNKLSVCFSHTNRYD